MSGRRFPVVVTLTDKHGKVVRQGTIDHPSDSCTFQEVPPGEYTASGVYTDGSKTGSRRTYITPNKSITYYLKDLQPKGWVGSKEPTAKPPLKTILSAAAAIALASNCQGAEPLVRDISERLLDSPSTQSPTLRNTDARVTQRASNNSYDTAFPPNVAVQLKQCIRNNIEQLTDIPTLPRLLELISWETEPSDEFEREMIHLYARYEQFQATIELCDPTLVPQIFAARERTAISDTDAKVFVIGDMVNVRSAASASSRIIVQLPYGTPLLVNQGVSASLSEEKKLAISRGAGWQPVILSDGQAGYIFSGLISASP